MDSATKAHVKKDVRCVVVGDGAVGKTCLVTAYGQNKFLEDHIPTVAANYEGKCEYDNQEVNLKIWDTSGQDEYKNMRPVAYNDADVFIICFSLM